MSLDLKCTLLEILPLPWGLLDQNRDIESAVHQPLNHGTTGNKRIL